MSNIVGIGKYMINVRSLNDVIERLIFILAAAIVIALLTGVISILGWFGVVTLVGTTGILIIIKWGWLWFLK